MDQIKPIIAAMAKHVFWAGCGLIIVVSVLIWYMSCKQLEVEFDKGLGDITSKVSSVKQLRDKSQQNPPNKHSHDGMDKLLDNTLQLVVEAWEDQYSYQEGILLWPRELEDDFIADVRPLKPIELTVDFPTPQNQKLDITYRHRYANYVEDLLPILAQVVRTDWAPRRGTGGGMNTPNMRTREAAREPPIVLWQSQDQTRLLGTHFNWSESAPSTLEVLYAQEDLWVLTALCHIIAKTNKGAESRHEAVVKTIESIMIGRGVTGRAGQVAQVGGRGGVSGGGMFPGASGGYEGGGSEAYPGTEGMGGMEGMGDEEDGGSGGNTVGGDMPIPESGGTASPASSGGSGGAMPMGMGGMGGTGAMRFTGDPADGRYVDNNYTPLRASRIRQAMRASNPADAFLVVAKRMPIRLRLVVDQRKLHRLLAECGNSRLPVEIRQVRLNRGKSSGGGGGGYDMGGGSGTGDPMGMSDGGSLSGAMGLGGGSGMGMGEGAYDDGSMGEESDGGSGQSMYPGAMGGLGPSFGDMAGRNRVSSTTSHDVPVELYGIIYIYNPPDRDRLGIEQTQEGLTGAVQPDTTAPG